ncbi:hypothetical protein [Cupriavidus taiwanensis]|uniref:Uncharacterized protein n=2 Tax=Cupriavidus taiwanensis TaxID=164546 RepID=B2AGA9_CUPTR|nr:hypothetical protein [Cupriavidus taiwanensis]CAP62808.1 conserved hypothetical protein [Cupriavidus taiwanensis LMG 19424]SOY85286.1 conserved hypothetical protein [Cupriavidus taiwanensis]SOZ00767.1 conserved hypothetical protein [Cupriavidus taiwanensis]SOZ03740.1 conserved hypothetical protein [Cupriavidus taiwanensis]SPC08423.1 conserved hypothetical protein [Cupriavidus taiwanensis]
MRTDWLARLRVHGPGLWSALWLALCLLLAQHAGLTHRIVHGGLPAPAGAAAVVDTTASTTAASDPDPHPLAQVFGAHSCVLFDGATVADMHSGKLPPLQLAFGKPVKPASLAWRWPDLPTAHPFQSRAPPALAIVLA